MPIGSILGGIISQGGANTAGGMASAAGNQAWKSAQHQMDLNNAAAAPWTALGSKASQQLGALFGYGGLSGTGAEGSTLGYGNDYNPAMQDAAIKQLNAFASASGAKVPTYTPNTFAPTAKSTAISGSFQADPSYAWRQAQGTQALNQGAAAAGMGLSGAQGQALTNYGQNAASQEYGNWYNRLANQNQFNLGVDQWNTTGGLATNAQNFGQQQTIYGDTQGQWNNALAALMGVSGQGGQMQGQTSGLNSGLTTSGSSQNLQGQLAAGQDYANGSAALAAGIKGGINSLASLGSFGLSGGFDGLFGGGMSSAAGAAKDAYNTSPGGAVGGQYGNMPWAY